MTTLLWCTTTSQAPRPRWKCHAVLCWCWFRHHCLGYFFYSVSLNPALIGRKFAWGTPFCKVCGVSATCLRPACEKKKKSKKFEYITQVAYFATCENRRFSCECKASCGVGLKKRMSIFGPHTSSRGIKRGVKRQHDRTRFTLTFRRPKACVTTTKEGLFPVVLQKVNVIFFALALFPTGTIWLFSFCIWLVARILTMKICVKESSVGGPISCIGIIIFNFIIQVMMMMMMMLMILTRAVKK